MAVHNVAESASARFEAGATIVRRDTAHGRVWAAAPVRVISDTPEALLVAHWPGVQMMSPASYIESSQSGLADGRLRLIRQLAASTWDLGDWIWQRTTVLTRVDPGEHFSVHRFFEEDYRPGVWYVNFELPARRTAIGYDTCDLCLDLVVAPDLSSYEWKDEDEYEFGRETGFITDAVHDRIEVARDHVLTLLAERRGPFATDWSTWRRDPAWPLPVLPPDALAEPVASLGD